MKLALFDDGVPGVVGDGVVTDVSDVVGAEVMELPERDRMPAIIEGFAEFEEPLRAAVAAGQGVPLDSVKLRPPLPRPGKILCALGNYTEGVGGPTKPLGLFLKAPTSVIGPGATVELPPKAATVFQHEAEIAMVIGKRAHRVEPDEAMDYVFGYTCFIDVSARGVSQGAGFADKGFDTFGPLGPWLVTADEFGSLEDVGIRLSVNGSPRQDYRTSDMEHPPENLIAWATSIATLEPGDVISCGTNHQGLGPVQDGDEIEIEIDGIGAMAVKVKDPLGRKWSDGVDQELADFMRRQRHDPTLTPPDRFKLNAAEGRDPLEVVE